MRESTFLKSISSPAEETCIVLAGGLGRRIRSLTGGGNKHRLLIRGKTAFEHALQPILRTRSVKALRIVIQPDALEWMRELIRPLSHENDVRICIQPRPDGTLSAVRSALDGVATKYMSVHYGDNLFGWNNLPALDDFSVSDSPAEVYGILSKGQNLDFGFVDAEIHAGKLEAVKLIEKPASLVGFSHPYVLTGFFRFKTDAFLECESRISISPRGEFELTEVIRKMISAYACIPIRVLECGWVDYGTPDRFEIGERILNERETRMKIAKNVLRRPRRINQESNTGITWIT